MPEKKPASDFNESGFPFQEYLEESNPPGDYPQAERGTSDISAHLTGTFEERLRILKETIEEIDSEIVVRVELSKAQKEDLKVSKDWVVDKINRFENWQFGHKPSVDFRRTALERELLGVYREARNERQRAFSDIVSLKKERRNLLMEYKSLKASGKVLSGGDSDVR
jgi:hypothetical protein